MSLQKVLTRGLAAASMLAVAAACSSDRAVAPTTGGFAVRASENGGRTDTSMTTFTVRPYHGIVKTLNGGHQLVIAPNAICDLGSSYGPDEWDAPCAPATSPITITARTWVEANGHPHVEFRPRLRFVPGPQANAVLWLMDKSAADDPDSKILYCADNATTCIDESIADPTVATQRDVRGFLYRRIKHFSGYNISSGFAD